MCLSLYRETFVVEHLLVRFFFGSREEEGKKLLLAAVTFFGRAVFASGRRATTNRRASSTETRTLSFVEFIFPTNPKKLFFFLPIFFRNAQAAALVSLLYLFLLFFFQTHCRCSLLLSLSLSSSSNVCRRCWFVVFRLSRDDVCLVAQVPPLFVLASPRPADRDLAPSPVLHTLSDTTGTLARPELFPALLGTHSGALPLKGRRALWSPVSSFPYRESGLLEKKSHGSPL